MYKFRLTISAARAGVFQFDADKYEFDIGGRAVSIVARNAAVLKDATQVHFEAGGYEDVDEARADGEKLRLRLRLLDAVLGLGLNVPAIDQQTGSVSEQIKEEVAAQHGVTLIDSVFGITVYPDDGLHLEQVTSLRLEVRKPDSMHLIDGIGRLWDTSVSINQAGMDGLAILGIANRESSPRAAFLTTYLALESLIPRGMRSADARQMLEDFADQVRNSALEERAKASLVGTLSNLHEESFPTTLMKYVERIVDPPEVKGKSLRTFLSLCISARNKIAHQADIPISEIQELKDGLREVVVMVLWSENGIDSFTIDVPGDQVAVPDGGFTIRML